MKNLWITLGLVLVAAATAFGVSYALNDRPELRRAAHERDAMAWLREEFHLNAAQAAAVAKLHDEYGAACGVHCQAIMAAKRRGAPAPEIAALEQTCVEAMTAHFRRVAALLPAGEGERYLAMVLPRVHDYDHRGAPNLQGKS